MPFMSALWPRRRACCRANREPSSAASARPWCSRESFCWRIGPAMSLSACASAPPSNECCARSRVTADATLQTAGPRNSPQGRLIGIDCSNEDHDPSIRAYIDWMRWRSPESADKMRRGLGGFIKSVCHTQARGGGDGNGPEQPLLRKLNAERTAGALLQRSPRQRAGLGLPVRLCRP
jgi:hypothetical protein